MTLVKAKIDIAAAPEQVYDVMLDPERLHEWVTIHRKINHADGGTPRKGYAMDQTLCLRHANFKVHWTLTRCDRPHHATWEGKGPAGSYARTSYTLTPDGDGTHFEYENEFKAPGGFLGAAASRVVVGGVPEREAQASLQQLKALLEQLTGNCLCAKFPCVVYRSGQFPLSSLESHSDGRLSRREAQRDPGTAERAQALRR